MATVPTFCFVIPCFNEEDNVGSTVASVREGMGGRDDYEIILVNDASTDRTLERMQALASTDFHRQPYQSWLRWRLQAQNKRCNGNVRHDAPGG
jgi:glycosyltransferase involved in cell wall biosynthesis